jgi:putative ABC transport system permease protein
MVFMAMDGIKERKFRVALNIVGILIGIAALTALVSITQGMNLEVNQQMERLGSTTITVIPGRSLGIMQSQGGSGTLTLKDVNRIERMSKVALATPSISGTAEIRIGGYSNFVTVLGIIPEEYVQIVKNIKVENGRFLRQSDGSSAVLGANVAHPPHLEEPIAHIGDRIVIITNVEGEEKTLTLRVAGILAKVGGLVSPDNQIFVTLRTAQQIFNSGNTVSQILIEAKNIEVVEDVVNEIQDELGKKATVISLSFIRETIGRVINTLGAVLGGVAAISLIVAGIAIINTMTISVMETDARNRNHESIGCEEQACVINVSHRIFTYRINRRSCRSDFRDISRPDSCSHRNIYNRHFFDLGDLVRCWNNWNIVCGCNRDISWLLPCSESLKNLIQWLL